MQCACYIAESLDGHPLRLNPCPEHERWAKAIRDVERDACARVIEEGQETFSDTRAGQSRHLTPRAHGNLAGLAYAEAIRARSTTTR